jgi:hypothetical protein
MAVFLSGGAAHAEAGYSLYRLLADHHAANLILK